MAYSTKGPTLSHEELAALDLIIMRAVQRGAQPNEVLGFISSIVDSVTDAAHSVTNVIHQAANVAQQATHVAQQAEQVLSVAQHFADLFGAAATRVEGPAAAAIKQVAGSMAKAPSLTLQQLIDIRRNAVN